MELHRKRKSLTELRPYIFSVVCINTEGDLVDTVKSFSCMSGGNRKKEMLYLCNNLSSVENIEYNGTHDNFRFYLNLCNS